MKGRKVYLDAQACYDCGGKCCKQMPGEAIPADIIRWYGEPLGAALTAAFSSGKWVIDWWEGDPRPGEDSLECGYYIRPRSIDDRAGLFCPLWFGACTFLASGGCELPPQDRPASCRLLEPGPDSECTMHGSGGKRGAAMAWLEHHDLILAVAKEGER